MIKPLVLFNHAKIGKILKRPLKEKAKDLKKWTLDPLSSNDLQSCKTLGRSIGTFRRKGQKSKKILVENVDDAFMKS